jgi:UDP-N-acetyl-D-glucosamine dehydrogenase
VTGFEVDGRRVAELNAGRSYIGDVSEYTIHELVASKRLCATTNFDELAQMDTISICVPTPLRKTAGSRPHVHHRRPRPDPAPAARRPADRAREHDVSGHHRELVQPKLEESGLKAGRDFFLAFSPERVDPGNATFHTRNIPKVVGGITPRCTAVAQALYGSASSASSGVAARASRRW